MKSKCQFRLTNKLFVYKAILKQKQGSKRVIETFIMPYKDLHYAVCEAGFRYGSGNLSEVYLDEKIECDGNCKYCSISF